MMGETGREHVTDTAFAHEVDVHIVEPVLGHAGIVLHLFVLSGHSVQDQTVMKMEQNRDDRIPMISTTANPFTGPVPIYDRMKPMIKRGDVGTMMAE